MKPALVISGGHIVPALGLIESIMDRYPSWDIHFFGRRKHTAVSKEVSEEYRLIEKLGITWHDVEAGRGRLISGTQTFKEILRVPAGIGQSMRILGMIHPRVVVSFGGYIGFAVSMAAFLRRTPLVIHEQTPAPGIANRISSYIADYILLGFPEATKYFPSYKRVRTIGIPIRSKIAHIRQASGRKGTNRLYVMGGVTGSRAINTLVFTALPEILKHYSVVHQTGREWIHEALEVRQSLPKEYKSQYEVYPYITTQDHARILECTSLVIARSGINTVCELQYTGIPAILIPLPISSQNEQEKNAQWYASQGYATVLSQNTLTPQMLVEEIAAMSTRQFAGQSTHPVMHPEANVQFVDILRTYMDREC